MASNYKLLLFLLIGVLPFSSFALCAIATGMYEICGLAMSVLPVALLLVTVLAAIIYAVGQMMGAETRARATVWATSLMTGAIIAAFIFILVPYILDKLAPDLGIMQAKDLCSLFASQYGNDGGSTTPSGSCGGKTCSSGQVCVNNQCVFQNPPQSCTPAGGSCGASRSPCCTGYTCTNGVCSLTSHGSCIPHGGKCYSLGVCCAPYECIGPYQKAGGACG